MSAAVVRGKTKGDGELTRETIAPLAAWDAGVDCVTTLEPGTLLQGIRIEKSSQEAVDGGAEPYVVWFEAAGRRRRCSLPLFQARTQAVSAVRVPTR